MQYYTETERQDALRIQTLEETLLQEPQQWQTVGEELQAIYQRIPANYAFSFTEQDQLYVKFWNALEFSEYVRLLQPQEKTNWLLNGYGKVCALYSIFLTLQKDWQGAKTVLDKGLALEPDNPALLMRMGDLICILGNETDASREGYRKSIAWYKTAFESRPYNTYLQRAQALRNLGFSLTQTNNPQEALQVYQAALSWEEHLPTKEAVQKLQQTLANEKR
jgi:hypothetical protein